MLSMAPHREGVLVGADASESRERVAGEKHERVGILVLVDGAKTTRRTVEFRGRRLGEALPSPHYFVEER
jgi:hypothetical protein